MRGDVRDPEAERILAEAEATEPAIHSAAGPGLDPDAWEAGVDPGDPRREGGPHAPHTPAVAESLGAFMARVRELPAPDWFVHELIPDEGVVVWHGRPRSMKTLTALDVMLSLALGESCALRNPRFRIQGAVGLLWLGEEDSARLDAFRFDLMLKARGILPGQEPETFRLVVRPGWDLETPAGQAELLTTIRDTSSAMAAPLRVLVIDPVRASMPSIDGGPKDAARARAFLLTIVRETTIRVIVLPHHDLKPQRDGKDERSRAERASGGVTFSMGDCMVNFERLNDREALAVPTSYKLGADPKPFRVRFESETPAGEHFRGYVRAVAETTDEAIDARARVLAWVSEHPWSSTSEIDKGTHLRTGESARHLAELEAAGLLVSITGADAQGRGRSRNAVLWGRS